MSDWLGASWSTLGWVVLSVTVSYAAMILHSRILGLRSFAQMSSFDFAANVAMGSIAASTAILDGVSLANGMTAMATLFALEGLVAWLRIRWGRVARAIDNAPIVLMAGPDVIEANLRRGRVTMQDLRSKLRQAGVVRRDQVRLVVMETTGEISVLTGHQEVEPWLVHGVRGARQLDRDVLGDG